LEVINREEKLRVEEASLKRMFEDFRDLCGRHIDKRELKK